MQKIPTELLLNLQSMTLDKKIKYSSDIIKRYIEYNNYNVIVATSGGKDSTVLLDLVRKINNDIKGVYSFTGLEYPEINDFIKTLDNIDIIKPKMSFYEVIKKYGYPVISKEISKNISRYRNTKYESQRIYRLTGLKEDGTYGKVGVIPKKWNFLIEAPFKISDRCCDILKKDPLNKYQKINNVSPFIGVLASDSNRRKMDYLKFGCTIWEGKHKKCMPLSIWTEKDIWDYIRINKINYCSIYDKGEIRTGCIFCMFGLYKSKSDRFNNLKRLHPELYDYCMNKLGIENVLNWINNNMVLSDKSLE